MAKTLPAVTATSSSDVIEVRGQKVMLDAVVAAAFGVETKRVNEAVARNPEKFGEAHCFRLTEAEAPGLRSQAATSKDGTAKESRGGARYLPHVFTVKGGGAARDRADLARGAESHRPHHRHLPDGA